MNSISRTAKNLDRVFAVIYWIMLICVVVAFIGTSIGAIAVFRGTPLIDSNRIYTLNFGNLKLMPAPGILAEIITEDFNRGVFTAYFFFIPHSIIWILMLRTVRNVLAPFIRQEPFHDTIAKGLKRLAILLTIETALSAVASVLTDHFIRNGLNIHELFLGDGLFPDRFVGAVWEQPSIDVTPLLFAGALYLLSKVFQYGQELQTLSDETL